MPNHPGRIVLFAFVCVGLSSVTARTQQSPAPAAPSDPKPYFPEPAISPDGSEIAFGSGGDIWSAPVGGCDARRLVADEPSTRHLKYSPDGKTLAFCSDRTGGGDIYLLSLATGELRRLTCDDGNELLDSWSRDGQWIYYSSS